MSSFWDECANFIQEQTGEKERRQLEDKRQAIIEIINEESEKQITQLNGIIGKYNDAIEKLNSIRRGDINKNIQFLYIFLNRYGQCKEKDEFVEETKIKQVVFPRKEYEKIEDIVRSTKWGKEKVFADTLFMGILGVKSENKARATELRKEINDYELLMNELIVEFKMKIGFSQLELDICNQYIKNLDLINKTILELIIPEIEVIDGFFQAYKIKELILSNLLTEQIQFSYDFLALNGTKYQKYYNFIKNAYAFYILYCRIFDTPVLTNLLEHKVTEVDKKICESEYNVLEIQVANIKATL